MQKRRIQSIQIHAEGDSCLPFAHFSTLNLNAMDNHIALPVNQHQKTVQIHSLVDHVDELGVEEHGADVGQMWDYGETCCLH